MDLTASWPYIESIVAHRLVNNQHLPGRITKYGNKLEIIGAAGELAARRFLGLEEKLHTSTDGGVDIRWKKLTIDVKATDLTPKVANRSLQWPEGKPLKSDIVLLTAVHIEKKMAEVLGFATRAEVLAAPINDERYIPCHEIKVTSLHRPWELTAASFYIGRRLKEAVHLA